VRGYRDVVEAVTLMFQFRLDNRAAGPIRSTWEDAAHDAVHAGYGVWVDPDSVNLDETQGATIERWTKP